MNGASLVETIAAIAVELVAAATAIAVLLTTVNACESALGELATARELVLLERSLSEVTSTPERRPRVSIQRDETGTVLEIDGDRTRFRSLAIETISLEDDPVPHVAATVTAPRAGRLVVIAPIRWAAS